MNDKFTNAELVFMFLMIVPTFGLFLSWVIPVSEDKPQAFSSAFLMMPWCICCLLIFIRRLLRND